MTTTLRTLASFNTFRLDGELLQMSPEGSLIADASGDLFGVTAFGGADNDGTVFEIVKTASGYASAPTTLVSFDRSDGGGRSRRRPDRRRQRRPFWDDQ
jgi:uncharacterized repeat protein (TIGR03803 family)